jgi:hypothetical protein
MSCPGLHCPGCSGRQTLGILAGAAIGLVVADKVSTAVAGHIWEIAVTVAVCFVLSVAASLWLERRSDAICTAFGVRHGIASRADVEALNPAGLAYLERHQPRKAIAPPPQVVSNNYFFGADAAAIAAAVAGAQQQPARVIRGEVER